MTSLDETAHTLWNTPRPPLGLLGAVCCGRAAAADLSEQDRAPFETLATTLLGWWPVKRRSLREICEKEFAACMDHYGRAERAQPLQLALEAAQHQMAAAMLLSPGTMRFHDLGVQDVLDENTFTKLVRALAKKTHTDLELWKGRLEYLLAPSSDTWPMLVERAGRMGLTRPMPQASKLPKPLRELARLSDLGAVASWSQVGPRHALLLQLGTTKRTAMLDDEQRAMLIAALPWLA
jgi:hypothetical protein